MKICQSTIAVPSTDMVLIHHTHTYIPCTWSWITIIIFCFLQLIGCALVGMGIWVMVDDGFKDLADSSEFASLQYAGIGLIVVGSIIMLVGFFGCCGAIRESQCLLVMVCLSYLSFCINYTDLHNGFFSQKMIWKAPLWLKWLMTVYVPNYWLLAKFWL